ncbi:MAG: MBL fold metallo-hydrolase [Syntrophomonadaceae bacterium]|jgi:phosphoribosyl 1,2-cyclic phosphodiesterase
MEVHILASGSTGNVAYFKFGNIRILVDVGISTRRIENKLRAIGVKLEDFDGVLITHEHIDHVKGLDVLIRRYHLPVFTRTATWEAIPCHHKLPEKCFNAIEKEFKIGEVKIKAHNISHDAADPVGFSFEYRRKKWVIATDMGTITNNIWQALTGADLAVLECNHDLNMLINGPYPGYLKKRILGRYGHLSNYHAAAVIAGINPKHKMQVFLAHLSQQNNQPDLALKMVSHLLNKKGCKNGSNIDLHLTYPDKTISYTG